MSSANLSTRVANAYRALPPTSELSLVVAISAIGVSYGVHGLTPTFIISAFNSLLTDILPGSMLTAGILGIGSNAQTLGLALSTLTILTLYSTYTLLGLWLKQTIHNTMVSVVVPVVGIWATESLLTGAPAVAVYSAFSGGLVVFTGHLLTYHRLTDHAPPTLASPRRRQLLGSFGTATLALVWGVTTGQRASFDTDLSTINETAATDATALLQTADTHSLDIDGLEPLVSTHFFEVDISAINPAITSKNYNLTINTPDTTQTYSYTDITQSPTETFPETLRCVGDPRNGQKMDNAVWTAVPLTEFIDFENHADTCCVVLRADDGYYEEFPLEALKTGYLAYGMNGNVLPREHGHPIRALIPGHWGEINVKWLTEIEILDEEITGYWEERGWHGTGPVNTVAKLHVQNTLDTTDDTSTLEIAGHAYAGTRGIQAVEVSTDNGETWTEATLSEPLDGTDVWRQWTYEYTQSGTHDVTVRAIEANGTVQPHDETGPYPRGASGYVTRTINPSQN